MPTTFVRSPDACRSPLCEGIHQSTDFEPNLKLSLATECLVNPAETNYQDIKQGKGGWYATCSKQLPRQGFAPELSRVVPPQPMKRLARADKGREAVKKPFLPSDVMAEVHICAQRTTRSSADQGCRWGQRQFRRWQRSIRIGAD